MRSITFSWAALGMCAGFFVSIATAEEKLPKGPGRETLMRVCSPCHSAENVVGLAKTREEWGALVGEMAADGAQASDDEFNEIVDYLATNFAKLPKINVNKAPAQELASGLELSAKEAEAIVQYREQKGGFKSVEDLAKVPGLDAKKIEAKKDRLTF